MTDESTSIQTLRNEVVAFNEARDWGQYHSPRNVAMAVAVEAGELLELFLWSRDEGPQPAVESRVPAVADEIADVAICLLNLCEVTGVDLTTAIRRKLEQNARRYPADTVRGRMEKYDEYDVD
jgi:NTP pyrophosphatase (non-canonical NTP hydrolase)